VAGFTAATKYGSPGRASRVTACAALVVRLTGACQAAATPWSTETQVEAPQFTDSNNCVNPDQGYRVAYPSTWYANVTVPKGLNPSGVSPCTLFGPVAFLVEYGTEISPHVAIWIRVQEIAEGADWNYGPFPGSDLLRDSETTVDGRSARVQEIEVTQSTVPFEAGDRYTQYIVHIAGGRYLLAQTYRPPDYQAGLLILDKMMRTLEFASS
jgi:hypothetical protein